MGTWSALHIHLSHKRRFRLALVALLLFIIVISTRSGLGGSSVKHPAVLAPSDLLQPSRHDYDTTTSDIKVLIPANQTNVHLCKLVLSSAILGYPAPILINWGQTFSHAEWRADGSHIAKLTGIHEWLRKASTWREKGGDIVLLVDGYDTWFQLPPEALVYRYRDINKRMTAREEVAIGTSAYEAEQLSQSILFSAQKNCGPNREAQLHEVGCYGQPESPLRHDLFGSDTDTLDRKSHAPVHMRPAWLCAGLVVGSQRAMFKMFEMALPKISSINHGGSDQHIFNEVYGEQQYQRELFRLKHQSFFTRIRESIKGIIGQHRLSIVDSHPEHIPPTMEPNGDYQCGISLDYGLEISSSAVFSEFDGQWLIYANHSELLSQQIAFGHSPPRATSLPVDLADVELKGPFNALFDMGMLIPGQGDEAFINSETRRLVQSSWADIPLYTNLYTGSIPVTIHMNGMKVMRENLWDRMWFVPHARTLLRAIERSTGEKIGAYADTGERISLQQICAGSGEEVFRDGLGDWTS